MRNAIPSALALLAVVFGTATLVRAHALLVQSSPADQSVLKSSPKQAILRFNAKIEKRVSQAVLLDSSGRKIAIPPRPDDSSSGPSDTLVIPSPPLEPGQYRLQYRVMAIDGHPTPGILRFRIENRGSS